MELLLDGVGAIVAGATLDDVDFGAGHQR